MAWVGVIARQATDDAIMIEAIGEIEKHQQADTGNY
jgi:hypothetical protein